MKSTLALLALAVGLGVACVPPPPAERIGADRCIDGRPNPEWIRTHHGRVPRCRPADATRAI